jgi:hypothetical protein
VSHTYAAWELAAGVNIYSLARRMGSDAEDQERHLLDAYDAALDAGDALPEGVM